MKAQTFGSPGYAAGRRLLVRVWVSCSRWVRWRPCLVGMGCDVGLGVAGGDVVAVVVGEVELAVGVAYDVPVAFVHAAMAAAAA